MYIVIDFLFNFVLMQMGIGDWGFGIWVWVLCIGDWAQSPIPNPQSPIPNPQSQKYFIIIFKIIIKNI